MEPLNEKIIKQHLINLKSCTIPELTIFPVIGSTNDYLREQIKANKNLNLGYSVLAEKQTKGKGRHGRNWISPYGNLYLSMYWKFDKKFKFISKLSLIIGDVVAKILQDDIGVQGISLKWPNDVLCKGKKLAGILIETICKADQTTHVVIGVGINIVEAFSIGKLIDQECTDLITNLDCKVSRNLLAALVISKSCKALY